MNDPLAFPAGRIPTLLDTDLANEIDDFFALAQILLSPERFDLKGVAAAPFHNDRSDGPADGMTKSLTAIHDQLRFFSAEGVPSFAGSDRWLGEEGPVESDAASALIRLSHEVPAGERLWCLAIGAPTNVASALLLDPTLKDRITVVWLGGNGLHWPHTWEFNLQQDVAASRVLFDSGVPLWLMPCMGVASHMLTSVAALKEDMGGTSPAADWMIELVAAHDRHGMGFEKEIWDLAAVAMIQQEDWAEWSLAPAPTISDDMKWIPGPGHPIRVAHWVVRNRIFRDFMERMQRFGAEGLPALP
ncbi:MAG: nucleoside hydrolase [Fimbriimonadaceae bacterium]|nr:nucleoside hydrolase [Fimbriimonadaceae bacterium]